MAAWVEGYVSKFGTEDSFGDINDERSFDLFLKRYRTVFECGVPMLLNHDENRLCGRWYKFWKDKDGLIGRGEVFRHRRWGRDAVKGILDGSRRDLSIGYWSARRFQDASRVRWIDAGAKDLILKLRRGGRRLVPATEGQEFWFHPLVTSRVLICEISLVDRASCRGARVQHLVNHGVSLADFGAISLDTASPPVSKGR